MWNVEISIFFDDDGEREWKRKQKRRQHHARLEICTMIYNQRNNFHISGTIGWDRERDLNIFFDATLPRCHHFSQPLKNILEKFLLISTIIKKLIIFDANKLSPEQH